MVGFPHGSHKTKAKVFEAEEAIKDGAEELDMVIHIGKAFAVEILTMLKMILKR